MKGSKRIIQDYKYVGTPGLPVNNFNGATYLTSTAFPNTTTLYGWRAGASGFTTIQGTENLTEQGTLIAQTDHLGNSVDCYFSGSQYLNNTSSVFNFIGTFSLNLWVYLNPIESISASRMLISRESGTTQGWVLYINGGKLSWYVNSTVDLQFDIAVLGAGWHMISLVRTSGTNTKLYINGVAIAIGTASSLTAAGNLEIGSWNGGSAKLSNYRITDVWIHNATAWTDAQVMAIYTASLPNHTHDQQFAGHVPALIEPGINNGEVLALYQFKTANILTDETGTYTLGNAGSVTNSNGIFGSNDNGAYFNGANTLYNTTLWNTIPSTSLTIDAMVMFLGTTGQNQYFAYKVNLTGGNETWLVGLHASLGTFVFSTVTGGVTKQIYSTTPITYGRWYHVLATQDKIYGARLFINGVLESQDYTATTLMANYVSGTNFLISDAGTGNRYFYGRLGYMRVWNKIVTQNDVDVAYSTRYDKTQFPGNLLTDISANAKNETQEWQTNFPVIAQDDNYIYRKGFTQGNGLRSGHQMLIKGGY